MFFISENPGTRLFMVKGCENATPNTDFTNRGTQLICHLHCCIPPVNYALATKPHPRTDITERPRKRALCEPITI